ncbi:hypothetical protein [Aliagarivorans marinus]|uniref:hypothetical protein n=1 Tax=Aliagarivorans marinus TaxID=561965 RepID=UPI000411DE35|nr:hypothetical protein [Aliagarivorans marinus]
MFVIKSMTFKRIVAVAMFFVGVTNTSGASPMEDSYYNREFERLGVIEGLVEKSGALLPEEIADYDLPEVLSSEELERRITKFQESFYIIRQQSESSESVNVQHVDFNAISNDPQNMAVGFRWLKVMTTEGENVIKSDTVVDREDVNIYYVNHNNGVADHMSMYLGAGVELEEEISLSEIEYVSGESRLYFFPGYEMVELSKEDVGNIKNTSLGSELTMEVLDKSYVRLSFDYSSLKNFIIYGYNKSGDLLVEDAMGMAYYYEDDRTVKDYSEEDFPGKQGIRRAVFHAMFKGELDKIELYFRKDKEERFVEVTAINDPTVDMDIDDYRMVTDGPTSEVSGRINYQTTTIKDQIKKTLVGFERSEALASFNTPELKVHLSDDGNSLHAKSFFSDLYLKQEPGDNYVPLEFYTRINGVIYSFYENAIDVNGGEVDKEVELISGKTAVRGSVRVDYPIEMEWVNATPGKSELIDNHTVTIEGGLVVYSIPEGYEIPDITWGVGGLIRAFDKDGYQLIYSGKSVDYNGSEGVTFKFGFWGTIHRVEIAVIKEWGSYHQMFDSVVVPELESNKGADGFAEALISIMFDEDEAAKIRAEIEEEKLNSNNQEVPVTAYKIELLIDVDKPEIRSYTWHGVLPGGNEFGQAHMSRLLKELKKISDRAAHDIPIEYRAGELEISFYSLNQSGSIEIELSENEILDLLPEELKTDSLIELLEIKWPELVES